MERKGDRIHLEFNIPSRGIIGLRNQVLTATAGEAIMTHRFLNYAPWRGDIEKRTNGSLIAIETGLAIAYALHKLQDRGKYFVDPGEEIYSGQVIGENTRSGDIGLNITKTKKLTNMRATGTDEKMHIAPAIKFSLEEALEYIQEDEYVEVTPKFIRLRKILLNENDRKRAANSSLQ
jgi:GTP-binding protein